MSIPSCTIFAREWTAKVCLRLCMQAPPERLLEQGILHFSNTFLKPPKTVQEDNGRPDGDINKNLSGASTSGKGILLRYSKYCCRTLDRESLKGISLSNNDAIPSQINIPIPNGYGFPDSNPCSI